MKQAIKKFIYEFLGADSTRIQLIFLTFLTWQIAIFYLLIFVPLIRELSIIYYRQNSINGIAINLDSSYGNTILAMLSTAFIATVGGYIASNFSSYKLQTIDYLKNKTTETEESK